MTKYRKKPEVFDAWQWTGTTVAEAEEFIKENDLPCYVGTHDGSPDGEVVLAIPALMLTGNDYIVYHEGWIIRNMLGKYSPCKAEIFEALCEKVES